MNKFIKSNYKSKFPKIAIDKDSSDLYEVKLSDYDNYINAVDKLIQKKKEDKRDLFREYILDKNMPKCCKYRGEINDMIDVIDQYLGRTIYSDNLFKLPYCDEKKGIRDAISILGISGSGKSWWIARYCELYKDLYPENDVFLITANKKSDPEFKNFKKKKLVVDREKIKQINFNEASFKNSCVILDDIESNDDGINFFIRELRDMLFEKSRKHNTIILSVCHKALSGRQTIKQNLECNGCVVFPRHNPKESRNVLRTYFDLDETQIKKVMDEKINNRWVYINKIYPRYYITEDKLQLLDL